MIGSTTLRYSAPSSAAQIDEVESKTTPVSLNSNTSSEFHTSSTAQVLNPDKTRL